MTFLRIRFRTYVHATESEEKVADALTLAMGSGDIEINETKGHFGNPITIMEGELSRAREVKAFFSRLSETTINEGILKTLDERMDDKCLLHFRLDKAEALEGRLELAKNDNCIRVSAKTATYPANRDNACESAREFLKKLTRQAR